jgi:hypothetical protein
MSRVRIVLALLTSAVIALLPLMLVAWMTSGSWSINHIRWLELVLIIPMLASVQLGLDHVGGLVATFFTYWAIAFALLARYIRKNSLEIRATHKI